MWNNNNSLTVGVRGPILLEDYQVKGLCFGVLCVCWDVCVRRRCLPWS